MSIRLSDQASKDEREERSWRSIFDVFDENQDGIFDRSELRVLLTKFSTATEEKITEIIELLDDDKSGEISFDEFYGYLEERGRAREVVAWSIARCPVVRGRTRVASAYRCARGCETSFPATRAPG